MSREHSAQWIIYEAAGRPTVLDAKREPMRTHAAKPCGHCDDPEGAYRFGDVVSDTFLPTTNANELLAGSDALCAACAFCLRDLKLRCAAFFATPRGVWFVRSRHLLRALLDPPEPPFVAALPLMGAEGGGESAGWRATWSTDPPLPEGHDVLTRMQAKATAIYATVAWSRDRFDLQVDGDRVVRVRGRLWRETVDAMDALVAELRAARCGYTEMRNAIERLRPPTLAKWHDARALSLTIARWPALTAKLRPHVRADWYRLVAGKLYEINAKGDDAP